MSSYSPELGVVADTGGSREITIKPKWQTPGSLRDPVSKYKVEKIEKDIQCPPLPLTHAHTGELICVHMCTYKNTLHT